MYNTLVQAQFRSDGLKMTEELQSQGSKKVVLIDMDGVIADFELGFQQTFCRAVI